MKIIATSNAGCVVHQELDCYVGDRVANADPVSYRVTSGHEAYGAEVLVQGDDAKVVDGRILMPTRIKGIAGEPVMLALYWEDNSLDRSLLIKTHLAAVSNREGK